MAGVHTLEFTDANFDELVLKNELPVLVDFWAPWCMPCRKLAPVIDDVADAAVGQAAVGKVNVDDCPQVAARYNIRAIPTILIFKNGQVVAQQVGAADKATLLSKLQA